MRCEILLTLERIINGLGSIGRNLHREIFKNARIYLTDRVLSVRSATAMVLSNFLKTKTRTIDVFLLYLSV